MRKGAFIEPPSILVVDDDYLIRWSLAQALAHDGYQVATAEDGWTAIESAKREHFDVVITDLVMPGLDGFTLIEQLRALQTPPRVIVMTAEGKEDSCSKALEKGAWAYLEKSCLVDSVREVLKQGLPTTP